MAGGVAEKKPAVEATKPAAAEAEAAKPAVTAPAKPAESAAAITPAAPAKACQEEDRRRLNF
jgi:hypothetical protein